MSEHHPFMEAMLKAGGPVKMRDGLAVSLDGEVLSMDPDTGEAMLAFTPDERFLQGGGVIHGGIVSTMLDYGLAMAGFCKVGRGRSFGTVSLTVHFLKPVLTGRHIVRARLDRMGASLIFASGSLSKEGTEAPLATGTAVMAIIRK
jgi:uncharacterized protein (TIGR00369 family)